MLLMKFFDKTKINFEKLKKEKGYKGAHPPKRLCAAAIGTQFFQFLFFENLKDNIKKK